MRQLVFIALVLGLPSGIGTGANIFRDGDTSWQVAAGQWIIQHGSIPVTDPFSFTAGGHPWVAMEWLSQIVLATAYGAAGYAGLAITVAAALVLLHAIIFFNLQQRVSTPALAATLIMMDLVLAPFVLARPHVLAWPLLAAWTVILFRAAEPGRAPHLAWALLLVVWTNLHASFPVAILVMAAAGLEALIVTRGAALRQWLLFGAVSLVALALNANGLVGLLQPFRTSTLAMLPLIGEWHQSSFGATPLFYVTLFFGVAAILWSGVRVPLGRLLLLLVLLAMAFAHVRHQSFFIIVAACLIPPLWRARPAPVPVSKWLAVGAVPLLAVRLMMPVTPADSEANPKQLIVSIPADLRQLPMYNGYIFGGPLILAGMRPFIDGRAEIYGDAFVADYVRIQSGDLAAFDRAVQRYGIRWAIIPNTSRRLIEGIESSGRWRRVHADRIGVILMRSDLPEGSR